MTRAMRLFVAVYPPVESASAMLGELDRLDPPPDPRHRRTDPGQVHLTLQFIGDTDARRLADVIESVRRAAVGLPAFTLTPTRLVTLPDDPRRRVPPRLIAMETDSPPALQELHARLVRRLAHRPRAAAEARFRPHFTLLRFAAAGARAQPLHVPCGLLSFAVREVHLMQSVLRREGAEHRAVERFALEPA